MKSGTEHAPQTTRREKRKPSMRLKIVYPQCLCRPQYDTAIARYILVGEKRHEESYLRIPDTPSIQKV